MTAEEIKSKIEFSLLAGETDASRLIVGTFTIACDCHVSHECFSRPELLEGIKERIREAVVRRMFDDQTNEMAYAVSKFLHSHYPGDHLNAMEDQKRLMKAARYQPPHFHSTSGGKNE